MMGLGLLHGQVTVRFRTEADCALVCVNDGRQNRPSGGWALVLPDDLDGAYSNFGVACGWAGLYVAEFPDAPDPDFEVVRSIDEACEALSRGRIRP